MPIPNFQFSNYMLLGSDDVVIFNGALPATFSATITSGNVKVFYNAYSGQWVLL